eukprot:TRINITY_DN3832_c0_g1_i1.p1 TRINITY_DN3832_c0_g1~~TRINITY_DN3832_c0_g1_i1.p1  ORF type:complete len:296 (+),score=1.86 TRINITY_DN3832_c0_g1_i1:128-1015(+)
MSKKVKKAAPKPEPKGVSSASSAGLEEHTLQADSVVADSSEAAPQEVREDEQRPEEAKVEHQHLEEVEEPKDSSDTLAGSPQGEGMPISPQGAIAATSSRSSAGFQTPVSTSQPTSPVEKKSQVTFTESAQGQDGSIADANGAEEKEAPTRARKVLRKAENLKNKVGEKARSFFSSTEAETQSNEQDDNFDEKPVATGIGRKEVAGFVVVAASVAMVVLPLLAMTALPGLQVALPFMVGLAAASPALYFGGFAALLVAGLCVIFSEQIKALYDKTSDSQEGSRSLLDQTQCSVSP